MKGGVYIKGKKEFWGARGGDQEMRYWDVFRIKLIYPTSTSSFSLPFKVDDDEK